MPERTSYAPGTPSWIDIGTDVEAAIPFYTGLFGWTTESLGEEAGGYGFFLKDGKQAAGFGPQMNPGPPAWSSYITVAEADAAVAAVTAAGGAVLVPAMDVMTAGRMAVCADPQGGVFSVWEPRDNIGCAVVNEPGALSWNELNSRDVEGSKAFYGAVFGWTSETHDMPGPTGSYTEFSLDGTTVAGMLAMPPMVPAEVPTYWLVYFAVEDCDASQARAQELGATVVMPATDIPPAGRMAVLHDPQGAVFAIIRMAEGM